MRCLIVRLEGIDAFLQLSRFVFVVTMDFEVRFDVGGEMIMSFEASELGLRGGGLLYLERRQSTSGSTKL